MSATLGTYFAELEPNWQIRMFERLDQIAQKVQTALTMPEQATLALWK